MKLLYHIFLCLKLKTLELPVLIFFAASNVFCILIIKSSCQNFSAQDRFLLFVFGTFDTDTRPGHIASPYRKECSSLFRIAAAPRFQERPLGKIASEKKKERFGVGFATMGWLLTAHVI